MARIRTIKPDFFTSDDIVSLSPLARLLYIATWLEADREGRLPWRPKTLKLRYLPGDDCNIDALAQELVAADLVIPYEIDGQQYAEIPSFTRHQVINNRETASAIPPNTDDACPTRAPRVDDACPTRADATGTPLMGREGKGKEGKGSSPSPDGDGCPRPSAGDQQACQQEVENDNCPHQAIVDAYHDLLPMGRKVRIWNEARRTKLRARWREDKKRQSVEWWRKLFGYIAKSDFLTGRTSSAGRAPFEIDLEWIITPANLVKIVEGKYDNRESAQ